MQLHGVYIIGLAGGPAQGPGAGGFQAREACLWHLPACQRDGLPPLPVRCASRLPPEGLLGRIWSAWHAVQSAVCRCEAYHDTRRWKEVQCWACVAWTAPGLPWQDWSAKSSLSCILSEVKASCCMCVRSLCSVPAPTYSHIQCSSTRRGQTRAHLGTAPAHAQHAPIQCRLLRLWLLVDVVCMWQ